MLFISLLRVLVLLSDIILISFCNQSSIGNVIDLTKMNAIPKLNTRNKSST